nr:MAG TPA: hypothetical protein [Caudoviricetes sp.]DAT19415.1 MAG TPA: hypothetical protein [Caudoviricetes sp.]
MFHYLTSLFIKYIIFLNSLHHINCFIYYKRPPNLLD